MWPLEHSRVHFSIRRLRTQFRAATRKELPCFAAECGFGRLGQEGNLEIGTWPRLKCTFYEQNLVLQHQPYFSKFMEGEADFRAATRKERPCFAAECGLGCLGHTGTPGWFRAATRKEQPCFAAECGPDPFGHTGALEGPFSILRLRAQFRAARRKERPCFAAECGFGRLGHTRTLEALEQPHEKNGPVLLQNVAPNPLGTHEHSRAHFSILRLGTLNQGVPKGLVQPHEKKGGHLEIGTWPKLNCTFYEQNLVLQNQPYFSRFVEGEADFRAATRKERPCFAAECGFDRRGHTWTPDGFRAGTRKERPCFAAECGPDPFGHTRALGGPFFPGLRRARFRVYSYL